MEIWVLFPNLDRLKSLTLHDFWTKRHPGADVRIIITFITWWHWIVLGSGTFIVFTTLSLWGAFKVGLVETSLMIFGATFSIGFLLKAGSLDELFRWSYGQVQSCNTIIFLFTKCLFKDSLFTIRFNTGLTEPPTAPHHNQNAIRNHSEQTLKTQPPYSNFPLFTSWRYIC